MGVFRRNTAEKYFVYNSSQLKKTYICFTIAQKITIFAAKNCTMAKCKVIFSEEVIDFLDRLNEKARNKIVYNVNAVAGGLQNAELFKKLEGTDIWEFRTLYNGICYRLLAFWDSQNDALVITTHGFIKKTNKTPRKEIAKAEKIRMDYFNKNLKR